jgi:putative toxin-antitoxin system antitoxin component (TIGR02293 family)
MRNINAHIIYGKALSRTVDKYFPSSRRKQKVSGLEKDCDICHIKNDTCRSIDMNEIATSQASEAGELERVIDLLGGQRVIRYALKNSLDAHDLLLRGLPGKSLSHLLENLVVLKMTGELENAVGMSLRTFQRKKDMPAKLLSQEQSGRTWKFAEILARATEVFGSQQEAEEWLERPAIGLEQRRPIDLLATPAGVELVEDLLVRIDYGVYA